MKVTQCLKVFKMEVHGRILPKIQYTFRRKTITVILNRCTNVLSSPPASTCNHRCKMLAVLNRPASEKPISVRRQNAASTSSVATPGNVFECVPSTKLSCDSVERFLPHAAPSSAFPSDPRWCAPPSTYGSYSNVSPTRRSPPRSINPSQHRQHRPYNAPTVSIMMKIDKL
uniref:Uncharacterized protein n=1 Tax=Anopheles atroparvus TaxID=41427 RepID=A0AAG5CW93_ANOAO